MIGCQLCSISNKCHVPSWIPTLSIQMAYVDVEESNCVCDSSEQRWVGHQGMGHLGQVRGQSPHPSIVMSLPQSWPVCVSDVPVLVRTPSKEFLMKWVCPMKKVDDSHVYIYENEKRQEGQMWKKDLDHYVHDSQCIVHNEHYELPNAHCSVTSIKNTIWANQALNRVAE